MPRSFINLIYNDYCCYYCVRIILGVFGWIVTFGCIILNTGMEGGMLNHISRVQMDNYLLRYSFTSLIFVYISVWLSMSNDIVSELFTLVLATNNTPLPYDLFGINSQFS